MDANRPSSLASRPLTFNGMLLTSVKLVINIDNEPVSAVTELLQAKISEYFKLESACLKIHPLFKIPPNLLIRGINCETQNFE